MKDVSLTVVSGSETVSPSDKEKLSAIFEKEIDDFSKYMSTIGDWKSVGELSLSERALIKTYLVQKYTGKVDG